MRPQAIIRASTVALALAGLAALTATAASAQDAGAPSVLPACIAVTTSARYVPYGYNHVVILKNGCSKPATCTVTTDVNPQPTSAEVTAGATVEVLTYSASPAQAFRARVVCKLH